MKPIVLGLGNDLLGDDAIGLLAVRRIQELVGDEVDAIECRCAGLSLLDPLSGRTHAIIVDAIVTGQQPVGTIYRIVPADLRDVTNLSPHYAGLPEVIRMAGHLGLAFPDEIEIIAIEAGDVTTIGAGLTPAVAEALDEVVQQVIEIVRRWQVEAPIIAKPARRPRPAI